MSRAQSSSDLWVCHLDATVSYRDALALQHELRARRLADESPDVLLLLEHPPVYTRGRRASPDELTLGEQLSRARGIEVVQTDRGGRVTYHGPGQLVGYPIMRVSDVGVHLRTMEGAIVDALAREGVAARSRCAEGADYTGVWVGGEREPARKIASIGVHVSRGVSTHGFAVNVNNDLAPFTWIVACGLPDVTMTSLARELSPDRALDTGAFRERMASCFCEAHGRRMHTVVLAELDLTAASALPRVMAL